MRQGEEADPAHRRPQRLRPNQLRARRGDSAQHHRPAGPVRGLLARGDRARVLLAFQHHPPGVPRLRSRRASGSSSARSRRLHAPRTCSSSLSLRPRSSAPSRRSYASRTRISDGRPSFWPHRTSRPSRRIRKSSSRSASSRRRSSQLAVSSKYKSEFIANMSHELRTPLNSLLILAEQLEDNPDHNMTDAQVEYASVIHSSGRDLLELLNSILELAKVESGTVTAEMRGRLSRRVARSAFFASSSTVAEGKGVGYSIDVDARQPRRHRHRPAAPPPDPQEPPRQCVQVHRAGQRARADRPGREADGARGRNLSLNASSVVALSVSDTGIGIEEEQQQRIFEAFAQGDGTTARLYGGTGLGLSISRELVGLLGGELTVVSTPGEGSTFTVYLPGDLSTTVAAPLLASPLLDTNPLLDRGRNGSPEDGSIEGLRILVVDDDVRNIILDDGAPRAWPGRGHGRRERGGGDRDSRANARDRRRPDGHHDAGDGRVRHDPRHPADRPLQVAADHRRHRQGDRRRARALHRRRSQRAMFRSRSTLPSFSRR